VAAQAARRPEHDQAKANLAVASRAAAQGRVAHRLGHARAKVRANSVAGRAKPAIVAEPLVVVHRPAPRTAGAPEQQVEARTASATAPFRRALAVAPGPNQLAVAPSVAHLEEGTRLKQAVRAAHRAGAAVAVHAAAGGGGRP